MEADGSGDYPTLEEAIRDAPAGAVIFLGPGTHRLDRLLVVDGLPYISKPLHLVGAGMDRTEVVYAGTGYVIRFDGDGPFVVEDITFRHEGGDDVVVVTNGEARFIRCRFVGASGINKTGLHFSGNATGLVQECIVEGNYHGISVGGEARVDLVGNTCRENGDGISFYGNAAGMVRGNRCLQNEAEGIIVSGWARPTLEDNVCTGNGFGILYLGTSEDEDPGGVARGNECIGNGIGILVQQAHPVLEDNVCNENYFHGIQYSKGGGGIARANECARNGKAGILVPQDADPDLELVDNRCHDNEDVDVDDRRP